MLVVPSDTNMKPDRKDLYQFLVACQQVSVEKECPQIATLSLELPPLDPLAVLQAIAQPEDPHFYFENGNKGEAIAAIGAAITFHVPSGSARFGKAQTFIQSCLANTITTGATDLPFAGPHFFCNFTFFDDLRPPESAFPCATVLLPRWQVARCRNRSVFVANFSLSPRDNIKALHQDLCNKLTQIRWANSRWLDPVNFPNQSFQSHDFKPTANFRKSVYSALNRINNKTLNKIVLADAIDLNFPLPINLVKSLNNLRRLYPDCYTFATGNGGGTNFIGASPERLLAIYNHQLITDALAGSAPRGKTSGEDTELAKLLLSSEKEIHEHRVVIDFICDRLTRLGLTPNVPPQLLLLQLSNIQHLWTPIQATLPNGIHPLDILADLHPTPAVAGVPRDTACQEIRRYEAFDRGLYAAPLGWIDGYGNCEFIVGIRSALIEGDRARLYAGAGIVAGSDPDKELAEVQLKLKTLLKALV